jgi:hypothetical protein
MSNDTYTRVVSCRVANTAGTSIAASSDVVVTLGTVSWDTHGGFASNKYTVPVSGFYKVTGHVGFQALASANITITASIRKNGTTVTSINQILTTSTNYAWNLPVSDTLQLVAGDYIELLVNQGDGVTAHALNTTAGYNYLSIERLSGPSAIAATESVSCIINGTAPASYTSNTVIIMTSTTVKKDSHSAYASGTGVYTVPTSGTYAVTCYFDTNAATVLATKVYVNGSLYSNIGVNTSGGVTGSGLVSVKAGDTIDFRHTSTWSAVGAGTSYITLYRTGN